MAKIKDMKVKVNVDTTDFIKSLRQLQESIKMNSNKIPKQLAAIPMSDEVKNEWTNDPMNELNKIILINRVLGENAAISERDIQKAIKLFGG